jgi:hypothetical protein
VSEMSEERTVGDWVCNNTCVEGSSQGDIPCKYRMDQMQRTIQSLTVRLGEARDALESCRDTMCFGSRDWSLNSRDAWLYGLIVGWSNKDDPDDPDADAMSELVEKHGWSPEAVARLKRLHASLSRTPSDALARYKALEGIKEPARLLAQGLADCVIEEMREVWGNTNANLIKLRRDAVKQALRQLREVPHDTTD